MIHISVPFHESVPTNLTLSSAACVPKVNEDLMHEMDRFLTTLYVGSVVIGLGRGMYCNVCVSLVL